jgi:hypothetical protein
MQGSEVMPKNQWSVISACDTRSWDSRERGASRFPFLLLLALTAAIVYLMAVFIPIYLGNRQMEDATAEILHRGALQNLNETDVRAQLQEKARQYGLPENRQIELWRDGRKLTARISYTRSVKFPFYTYKWPMEIRVQDVGL